MIITNEKLNIKIYNPPDFVKTFEKNLEKIIHQFQIEFDVKKIDVEISFIDEKDIEKINKKFRGKESATNVLSFPDEENNEISNICVGEMLICEKILLQEAQESGKKPINHFLHLLIHSFLHIMGFGHDIENDAILMERKEIEFLSKIGISDPYK